MAVLIDCRNVSTNYAEESL